MPPRTCDNDERTRRGCAGVPGDAAAGGDDGCEDTSQLRNRSSLLLLSSTFAGANEFTEACPTTFCLLPFPSSLPSCSFPSLLTFVTVRCVGFLTAPVFAISIAYCRDVRFDSKDISIRRIFFFASLRHGSIYFFPILPSLSSALSHKILSSENLSGYNIKLRFLI